MQLKRMTISILFHSVLLFSFSMCFAFSSSLNSNHICLEEQSNALLLFKQSLSSINFSIDLPPYDTPCKDFLGSGYYPMLTNWSMNTDCCKWDGITCDYFTGDVIGIDLSCGMLQGTIRPNSTLFHLPHLERLNLAFNDFSGSQIPHEIGKFSNSLTHLNISYNDFEGKIPSEILFLTRLISLDLSRNRLNIQPTVFTSLLQNSTHLRELLFTRVNISSALPTYLNISYSLKTLDLSDTILRGKLPHDIFSLPYLQKLDLSLNSELTGPLPNVNTSANIPLKWLLLYDTGLLGQIPDSFSNLTFLNYLFLSYTRLSGQIPDSIGNLKFLNALDISNTFLSGKIPDSIGNLKFLYYLDLSETRLSGKIPDSIGKLRSLNHLDLSHCILTGFLPKSIVNLTHLSTIDLSYNKLNGTLPSLLFTLPSLETLILESNMFSGCLPSVLSKFSPLDKLSLSDNQFDGHINQGFIKLMNLTYIDLRFNKFMGLWELDTLFSSLPKLVTLSLSYSGLSVVASNVTGYVNTKINVLDLASCKLTLFPGSLQGMKNLAYLDLSRNYIQGRIPNWVGEMGGNQLYHLDLSYNSITDLPQFQWDGLQYLSLQTNQIEGHFPSSICNMSYLGYLDLSNNRFGGKIPQCIGNILSYLAVVNMGNNSFHGTIPNVNMEYCYLQGFILSGNQLAGVVPSFLSKCYNLKVLDIGNNYLNDTFPHWLENLSYLQILILKSNRLHGFIETSSKFEESFPSLQILDLSHNGLAGHLPQKYFQNFNAMKDALMEAREPEYLRLDFNGSASYYSLTIEVKGHQQLFSKINVHYTIIDLSNNKFDGEIPMVIGNLKSLIALNLSHNNLNGRIPYALGNLLAIESLDLSWNQLIGDIPQSLVGMTNLAVLNLSQNHLVGPIPKGKQFDTFEENSFGGNLGLCGHQLPQLCEHVSSPQLEDDGDEEESKFTWKALMLGYGCGTVIGLVTGYIMLSMGRPRWFSEIVDAVEHTILKRQKRRRYINIGK